MERENKKKYDFLDGSTFVFFPLIFSLFLCFVGWKNGNQERDSVNEERRISKFLGREAIIMIKLFVYVHYCLPKSSFGVGSLVFQNLLLNVIIGRVPLTQREHSPQGVHVLPLSNSRRK